jgi:hypothetical protein
VLSELAAGIDTNLEEIRSAVDAIPPSAISAEPDWMKFARAMAHHARMHPDQAEAIFEIFDEASRRAPGYDEAENRKRWLLYIGEAFNRDDPITIATVFYLAKKLGWQGASSSIVALADDVDPLNFIKTTEADAVARVNREFFFRRDTSEICRRDDATGEIQVLSPQQLKTALAGRWVSNALDPRTGKAKVRAASEVWLESRDRKEVHGIQYCPNNVGLRRGNLNLWRCWGVEAASGDCSIVLDHIQQVITAGDERKAKFILDWCADIVQNPTRKPSVALVLGGREGTGKSVFGAILRRLLDPENVVVNADKDRLLGRFNSALAGKILIQAEESFFAGDSRTADALKNLITGSSLQIEIKFGRSFEIESFHRLLMTSNHAQVVQASSEARRFVVCEVSNARRGDADYFDQLYAVADGRDEAVARAFMHHLLNRDLSNFRPWADQQEFLADEALIGQKILSLSPPLTWLWEAQASVQGEHPPHEKRGWELHRGMPGVGMPAGGKWPCSFLRSDALNAFREWVSIAKPHGAPAYTGSEQRFWNEITRVIPRRLTAVKDASGNRRVEIPLSELHANFQGYMRGEPNE